MLAPFDVSRVRLNLLPFLKDLQDQVYSQRTDYIPLQTSLGYSPKGMVKKSCPEIDLLTIIPFNAKDVILLTVGFQDKLPPRYRAGSNSIKLTFPIDN